MSDDQQSPAELESQARKPSQPAAEPPPSETAAQIESRLREGPAPKPRD